MALAHKPRTDLWKTQLILESLRPPGSAGASFDQDFEGQTNIIAHRFQNHLMQYGKRVDTQKLGASRDSWRFLLTNLALYSEHVPGFVSNLAFELASFCDFFDLEPAMVFRNDWFCMANKQHLYAELGPDHYYSHPVYMSHLWLENVAARRLYFVSGIQGAMKELGMDRGGCRIADIGCGMGGTLRLFSGARQLIGIDISEPVLKWCNETRIAGERHYLMDCRATGLPARALDVVLCFDLLEHVEEPTRALREIRRVVKRQGLVAIVFPFGSDDWDSHISLVEKHTFDGWLEQIGFNVLEEVTPPGEQLPCSVCYLLN